MLLDFSGGNGSCGASLSFRRAIYGLGFGFLVLLKGLCRGSSTAGIITPLHSCMITFPWASWP